METIVKYAKLYILLGFGVLYGYIIYKMIMLNWFASATVPTMVIYGFFMFMAPIIFIQAIKFIAPKKQS